MLQHFFVGLCFALCFSVSSVYLPVCMCMCMCHRCRFSRKIELNVLNATAAIAVLYARAQAHAHSAFSVCAQSMAEFSSSFFADSVSWSWKPSFGSRKTPSRAHKQKRSFAKTSFIGIIPIQQQQQ